MSAARPGGGDKAQPPATATPPATPGGRPARAAPLPPPRPPATGRVGRQPPPHGHRDGFHHALGLLCLCLLLGIILS